MVTSRPSLVRQCREPVGSRWRLPEHRASPEERGTDAQVCPPGRYADLEVVPHPRGAPGGAWVVVHQPLVDLGQPPEGAARVTSERRDGHHPAQAETAGSRDGIRYRGYVLGPRTAPAARVVIEADLHQDRD